MMNVRTLRPCMVGDREVRAGLCLSLPTDQAEALVSAGDAEPWEAAPRAPRPSPYAPAAPAAQPQE